MASPTPIDDEYCSKKPQINTFSSLIKLVQMVAPFSLKMIWISDCGFAPMVFLSTIPDNSSPCSMRTNVSVADIKFGLSPSPLSGLPLAVATRFTLGMMMDRICLPVHNGCGRRMAGIGMIPSHVLSRYMSRLNTSSRLKNWSRFVNFMHPNSASCTIPITGAFLCGVTICVCTLANSINSALAFSDCGTCKFISSPSKSALYGEVTDKLMRNVDHGKITT
mmetsp:Transcript_29972/g.47824  ORF Transcript_29972/g.47824 Transcript_29972/m.47824 type:complete len:221 (+) Transcript_29972:2272-2934(+)